MLNDEIKKINQANTGKPSTLKLRSQTRNQKNEN
jgi:hypothetical protein